MSKKQVRNLLLGYEEPVCQREDGGEINTGIKFAECSLSGGVTSAKKKILTSAAVRFFGAVAKLIAYTSTKGYGALFLSYGLLTIIGGLAKAYFGVADASVTVSTVLGAGFALFAIPLLLVERPFCIALQDFPLTDYIFFEFFSIKRMHRQTREVGIPPFVMVIFGLLLSGAGIFFGTEKVLAVALAAVIIYVSFVSPEFAFFSTIIMVPILPMLDRGMLVLVCMIAAAFVSFVRKVVFGKRVFSIEQYDLIISAFLLCVLVSGIFMKGTESFTGSLWLLALALGYPLASNLVTNRRLADCAIGAVLLSSVSTFVYTVGELTSIIMAGGYAALAGYSASAAFTDSGAYAAYLTVAVLAAAYLAAVSKGKPIRILYFAALAANLACLVLTRRPDALLALAAGVIFYFFMRYGKNLSIIAAAAVVLPLLLFLLPAESFDFLMSTLGVNYAKGEYILLWRSSLLMFLSKVFTGVGIGDESFSSEIADFGFQGAKDSSNLFIEIGCEAGVFALLFFVLLMIVRLFHRAVYRGYVSDSQVSTLSYMAAAMTLSFLAFGMTEHVWSDNTLYYLFWCIFGIGSAAFRISKREHDDRVMYYGDIMSVDSSVIDVKIK